MSEFRVRVEEKREEARKRKAEMTPEERRRQKEKVRQFGKKMRSSAAADVVVNPRHEDSQKQ